MERNGSRSVITGGVIVLIGVVYLLFNLGILPPEWKSIIISWQGLLILLGLIGICKGNFVGGTILAGVGVCKNSQIFAGGIVWGIEPKLVKMVGRCSFGV